jgi:hypothetical protein
VPRPGTGFRCDALRSPEHQRCERLATKPVEFKDLRALEPGAAAGVRCFVANVCGSHEIPASR